MEDLNKKLHPNWVTGFTDGEGCFTITIVKDERQKTGWHIKPSFKINLHKRDKRLLEEIKNFFNCVGSIYLREEDNKVQYQVRALKDIINVIIPHFEKYPLITQKQADFLIWRTIMDLINKKEHLTNEGLISILNLRASLNKGLSPLLNTSFTNVIKIKRNEIILTKIIDPNWFAGFFSGKNCFYLGIRENKNKTKYYAYLETHIGQHFRDQLLIEYFVNYFNCGFIYYRSIDNFATFKICKFEDIYNIIIPLFKRYQIRGIKLLDFQDFCKAAELINNKVHLTEKGLNKIKEIKSRMNKNRC